MCDQDQNARSLAVYAAWDDSAFSSGNASTVRRKLLFNQPIQMRCNRVLIEALDNLR